MTYFLPYTTNAALASSATIRVLCVSCKYSVRLKRRATCYRVFFGVVRERGSNASVFDLFSKRNETGVENDMIYTLK